ncbi:MAG: hypothetical protein K2K03_00990, partial [Prevotella sp.]|nr:hypothetical protein [Prevotella sp.]
GGLLLDNALDVYYHKLNSQKLVWAVCFSVGAFLLCVSPGNFTRTDAVLPLYNHLLSFARLRVFWLFLLTWCLFSRSIDFVRTNRLLLMALLIQATFMFYAGYRNARVLWGVEFFSLILLLKIFADKEKGGRVLTVLSYMLLTLLLVHFSWLAYRSGEVRKQYDKVIALYLESPDGKVYYDLYKETPLVRNYIPTPFCNEKEYELITCSLYYTRNKKSLSIHPKKHE